MATTGQCQGVVSVLCVGIWDVPPRGGAFHFTQPPQKRGSMAAPGVPWLPCRSPRHSADCPSLHTPPFEHNLFCTSADSIISLKITWKMVEWTPVMEHEKMIEPESEKMNKYFDFTSCEIVGRSNETQKIFQWSMVVKWCKTWFEAHGNWLRQSEAFGWIHQKNVGKKFSDISTLCCLLSWLWHPSTQSHLNCFHSLLNLSQDSTHSIKESLRNCVFSWRFRAKVQSLAKDLMAATAGCF